MTSVLSKPPSQELHHDGHRGVHPGDNQSPPAHHSIRGARSLCGGAGSGPCWTARRDAPWVTGRQGLHGQGARQQDRYGGLSVSRVLSLMISLSLSLTHSLTHSLSVSPSLSPSFTHSLTLPPSLPPSGADAEMNKRGIDAVKGVLKEARKIARTLPPERRAAIEEMCNEIEALMQELADLQARGLVSHGNHPHIYTAHWISRDTVPDGTSSCTHVSTQYNTVGIVPDGVIKQLYTC